jgi:hypothetical protein
MREQVLAKLDSQLSRLPLPLRILRNPIAVVLATYLAYYSFGQVLLGNSLVILLLDTESLRSLRLWDKAGACGKFSNWLHLDVIPCRLFYPKEVIILYFIPFNIMAFFAWVIQSVTVRRFVDVLSRRQRRYLILSMYLVATASLIVGLVTLPRLTLFTGPIHGFHPLAPLLRDVCSFVSPLLFWYFIGASEAHYLSDEKDI